MKKILLVCFAVAMLCLLVVAADKDATQVAPATSSGYLAPTGVPTEADLAKQIFERFSVTGQVTDQEKELMDRYGLLLPHSDLGGPMDAIGGPDGSYYYYADNMAGGPDTVQFGWIELCGDPNAVNATGTGDEGVTTVTLPWSFSFYGAGYTTLNYQVNGWIQFGSTTNPNGYTPSCPWASLTHTYRVIAAYYRDQYAGYTGSGCNGNNTAPWMRHRIDPDKLIIEWMTDQYGSSPLVPYVYEAILYADGRIKLQYNFTPPAAATGAVGIDGTAATDGVQYACGSTDLLAKIVPGRAVWFYRVLPQVPELGVSNLAPCGGTLPPNQNTTVSLRVTNNGGATSAATNAHFSFDGGAITDNAAVPPIAPSSFFDVFFSIPISAGSGSHTLGGWIDHADAVPTNDSTGCTVSVPLLGQNCVNPIDITGEVALTGQNNCGLIDDYNNTCLGYYDGGEDILYRWTVTQAGQYTIWLNPTTYTYSGILLDDNCPPDVTGCLAYHTNSAATPHGIVCYNLAPGVYYIMVDTWPSPTCIASFGLTITMCQPCIVACQDGDLIEGTENPADPQFYRNDPDGGCNSVPPSFGQIECGQTVCGLGFTYVRTDTTPNLNYRDTDWYVFTIAQEETVRVTGVGEFPITVGIASIVPCSSTLLYSASSAYACTTATVTAGCLPAGTYAMFVAPNATTGYATPGHYRATLLCDGICPPCPYESRDVEPLNNTCGPEVPSIGCGESLCGRISIVGDADFYKFTLTETDTVKINVYADDTPGMYPYGRGLDSYVVLYGPNCDSIAYNDDFHGTLPGDPVNFDSGIRQPCMTAGTYYLKVRGYGNTSVGPYILNLACVPCCAATPMVQFSRFPIPQYFCAQLCVGVTTQLVVCGAADPTKPPIVTVLPGCSPLNTGCDEDCLPAQFTYDAAAWTQGTDGCWHNTIVGLTNGCVCVALEGFLAVEMSNPFTAVSGDRSVTLTWSTASEPNNARFEISRDEVKVADVTARGSNSSGAEYTWMDRELTNGTTYHYSLVAVDINGNRSTLGTAAATPVNAVVITEYALHQNYPNPFNPETQITFDLLEAGTVNLTVYNLMGQAISSLVHGSMTAGRHIVSFDATNLPSGVYLYRIEVNGFTAQHKMLLMK
jgi:hypothetical protein